LEESISLSLNMDMGHYIQRQEIDYSVIGLIIDYTKVSAL